MHAQCPHCSTLFRITHEQLQLAEGFVRCSVCDWTFNAEEQQSLTESTPSADDQSIVEQGNEEESSNASERSQMQLDIESDVENDAENNPFSTASSLPTSDTQEDSLTNSDNEEDSFNLFENENEGEDEEKPNENSVVPAAYIANRPSKSASLISSTFWSIAIIGLAFTLIIEYVWFNKEQLSSIDSVRPYIEKLCNFASCETASLRSPSEIELLSRNIYTHPNEKNALMISVTMVNHAAFAQSYPDMQIDFSDIRGNPVASRRFTAEEYLEVKQDQLRLLPPDLPNSFTIEIADPGKQAMTYEFNFL